MIPRGRKKTYRLPKGGRLKAPGVGTIRAGSGSIVTISNASIKGVKIRRKASPIGQKKTYRLPKGGRLKVPGVGTIRAGSGSLVKISQANIKKRKKPIGGKKMPRKPTARKKVAKKKTPQQPLINIKGQSATINVEGSKYGVKRGQDIFTVHKLPKKPKVIRK